MKKRIEQLKKMLSLIIATTLTCIGNIGTMTATFGLAVLDISLFGQHIIYAEQKKSGQKNYYRDPILSDESEFSDQVTSFFFHPILEFPEPRKDFFHTTISGESGSRDKMYRTPNKPHINKNLHFIDRIVRIFIAAICTQTFLSGISSEISSLLVLLTILTLLPTAIFGFCPIYYIAGVSTCRKRQELGPYKKN